MDLVCVIPARLKSSRLPHKPLLDICGKTMLERTFNRARAVLTALKSLSLRIVSLLKTALKATLITS